MAFILLSCTDFERNNPGDPGGTNYKGSSDVYEVPDFKCSWNPNIVTADDLSKVSVNINNPNAKLVNDCTKKEVFIVIDPAAQNPDTAFIAVGADVATSGKLLGRYRDSWTWPTSGNVVFRSTLTCSDADASGSKSSNCEPLILSWPICGELRYNPETHFCLDGMVTLLCGGKTYTSSQFCDTRDSKLYKHVKIEDRTWMAENLNYNADGSKCYGEGVEVRVRENNNFITKTLSSAEVQDNCAKYGRMYNWPTAIVVCPKGWHLPSDGEWGMLVMLAGGLDVAGTKLKAKSGWASFDILNEGTDNYGFSALPGGLLGYDGFFEGAGYDGYWWSASEKDSYNANSLDLHGDNSYASQNSESKNLLFSIRCLQD